MHPYDSPILTLCKWCNTRTALVRGMDTTVDFLRLRWFCILQNELILTDDTFSQANVTQARARLAETCASDNALMTSNLFRDCLPYLLGNSIMEKMGLELMVSLSAEHKRRTRSTDPIGYDENVVTVVDPKDVWREDIVDVVKEKKLPSNNKAVAVTAVPKQKATKTDREKLAIKRDMLSMKKAVTAPTDPKKKATKTDLKKPAKKRDHQEISAPGPDSTTATTSTITTVPALMNGGNGDGGDDVTIDDEVMLTIQIAAMTLSKTMTVIQITLVQPRMTILNCIHQVTQPSTVS